MAALEIHVSHKNDEEQGSVKMYVKPKQNSYRFRILSFLFNLTSSQRRRHRPV